MIGQKKVWIFCIAILHIQIIQGIYFRYGEHWVPPFNIHDHYKIAGFLPPFYYDQNNGVWRWGNLRFGLTSSFQNSNQWVPPNVPVQDNTILQEVEKQPSAESFPRLKNFFRRVFNGSPPAQQHDPNAHLTCSCPKRKLPLIENPSIAVEHGQKVENPKLIVPRWHEQKRIEYAPDELCMLHESLQEPNYYVDYHKTIARNNARSQAIEQILAGNTQETFQSFTLTDNALAIVSDYQLSKEKYIECIGNTLQHLLHAEILFLASLSYDITDLVFRKFIISLVDTAADGNHSGLLKNVIETLDFCWYVTETAIEDATQTYGHVIKKAMHYTSACVEGVALGLSDIPRTIINIRPITKNLLRILGLFACSIPPIDDDGNISQRQMDFSAQCYQELTDPIIAHCKNFYATAAPEDYMREGVRFVSSFVFNNLLCSKIADFIKEVNIKYLPELAEKIGAADSSLDLIATSPEGLSVKVATEFLEEANALPKVARGGVIKNAASSGVPEIIKTPGNINIPAIKPGKEIVLRLPLAEGSKGLITQTLEVTDQIFQHIFSGDHLRDGLDKIGKTPIELLEFGTKLIAKANAEGKLRFLDNRIQTMINGHKVMVSCYIAGNKMQSMNIFIGHSTRTLGNVFEFYL